MKQCEPKHERNWLMVIKNKGTDQLLYLCRLISNFVGSVSLLYI